MQHQSNAGKGVPAHLRLVEPVLSVHLRCHQVTNTCVLGRMAPALVRLTVTILLLLPLLLRPTGGRRMRMHRACNGGGQALTTSNAVWHHFLCLP